MIVSDEGIELLRELLKWTRVGFHPSVQAVLESALSDNRSRVIYQLADGARTVQDIRKAASVSPNKVLLVFKRCESLGLIEMLPTGQRRRLFDLNDFGLAPHEGGPDQT